MNEFNEGHIVEGLDRLHIITCNLDEYLSEHPAILKAGVQDKVLEAISLLGEAYQAVGGLDED